MTDVERRVALEAIAAEVRTCTNCRLHATRTVAVPGEGDPETEVVFVGEGPGFHEDRQGRPFVGRAGDLLVKLLATIGWRRDDVFITNVVKCRPPDNRDPMPDEIAACAPYLQRQLAVLDPAVVVTLGRYSMATFMPGARISQAHGTVRPVDPATGASSALVFAMYHPAAALRTPAIERESYADIAAVPAALLDARRRRGAAGAVADPVAESPAGAVAIAVEAGPPGEAGPAGEDRPAGEATPGTPDAGFLPPSPVAAEAAAIGQAEEDLAAEAFAAAETAPILPPTADDPAPQLTLF